MQRSTWDESAAAAAVVDAALSAPRAPLIDTEAIPPGQPGAYLLYLAVDELRLRRHPELAAYGLDLLTGRACCYVGAAHDSRSRAHRHVSNLERSVNLAPEDLWIAVVPCETVGGALFAEAALDAAFSPIWGHAALRGFGSRPQGRTRQEGQRPSPWDCLHRRDWAPEPTLAETGTAVAYLAAHVVGTRPERLLRHALVASAPGRPVQRSEGW